MTEHESALAAVHNAAHTTGYLAAPDQPAVAAVVTVMPPAAAAAQPGASPAGSTPSAQPAAQPPASVVNATADQLAAARAEGQKAGAIAERQRLSAIMKLDAAKERQPQALALALDTDVTAEQADSVLKAMPASATADPFTAAMGKLGNPSLGSNAGKPAEVKPQINRAAIFQHFNNPTAKAS